MGLCFSCCNEQQEYLEFKENIKENIKLKNYELILDDINENNIKKLTVFNNDLSSSIHVEFKFENNKLISHTQYNETYKKLLFKNILNDNLIVTHEENIISICNSCQTKKPNYVFIPCGHTHMCHSCNKEWMKTNKKTCYICEENIDKLLTVYL
jgi:hypothetical protein